MSDEKHVTQLAERVRAVIESPSDRLDKLVTVTGLDASSDLRFGDWRNFDFTGADLRGFDFTGADLTGTRFDGALVAGAKFDGALYDVGSLKRSADFHDDAKVTNEQIALTEDADSRALPRNDLPTMPVTRRFLENSFLFRALDEYAQRELVSRAWSRSFQAGEPIFRIGEPGGQMMAVVTGTVRVSLPSVKGRELILADLPEGELVGEISLLDGHPHSTNVTALTKSELLIFERRVVLPFLRRHPDACLQLMKVLCSRVRRSDGRISDIAFFDLPARLAKILLEYPAGQHRGGQKGHQKLSLSHRELAEMAGGTRENVNRCMRDWQRRGILALKDRWTIILKPEVLRELLVNV